MSSKLSKKGFTLIELLIVVALIGILTGVVLAVLNPAHFRGRARDTRRKSDLGAIRTAIEMYYSENGAYPASVPFGSQWAAGGITYLKSVPQDPQPPQSYTYQITASGYDLCAQLEINIGSGTNYCVTNPF